ncbi:hypothetical protein D0Z03_001486 [Geotrichum reessii]|nr:hypothetical protein D0Z03_001486 [Galactomyces reessii]
MSSLKSFIKAVRAAKTIADERTVIQKESAAIRTSFREDYSDVSVRRQNVAKLLYLFTLGERTHWGQVECLKLLASPRFTDKRLGYLGTMLLLDENQEVLTLVTNSLQTDLNHPNQYIVSLALCTLANIASTEMARDLFADIEKVVSSSNPYLRKKGALCAMRIIRKVPDLEEVFVEKAKSLLSDKNHGVLICGIALINDLCVHNPELINTFKKLIPVIIKHIKSLSTSGYVPEYDVSGIADPFLQVKLLRLLRILGAGDVQASEQMSDILAQIASNTDSSKTVGSSVLYEAVQTIFGIEADSGLRVLGVNILGKFLTTKDNNTRYVALNTLLRVIDREPNAVQRHRAIIIECLQDSDISIRRRALELSYALINGPNVRVLVRELLSFLETADAEFKPTLTSQIAIAAEKYAPTKRWHIDTIIRMLKIAGSYAKENVLSSFIILVIGSEDLQLYTVQKLYTALRNDVTQEGLTLVGTWLIGEYAKTLLDKGSFEDEDVIQEVNETEVVNLLETIVEGSYATEVVKEYVLNALMKLTTRISSSSQIERIRRILNNNSTSLDIEIQQRVAEYSKLFSYDAVRRGVLEKMPAPEVLKDLSTRYESEKAKNDAKKHPIASATRKSATPVATTEDLLLDLMSDATPQTPSASSANNNNNLLSDLFSSSSGVASPPPPVKNANIMDLFNNSPAPQTPPVSTQNVNLNDLLGGTSTTNSAVPAATATVPTGLGIDPIEAYNKGSLRLTFQPTSKDGPGSVVILAKFVNNGSASVTGLNLQVAVPKTQKLQLQSLSSSNLATGQTATQQLKVTGAPGTNVRLRLRILYTVDGQEVKEQVDFGKFPPALL